MIRLKAPAKLNLYLRILSRRPDGFHEIETLFERIDLADELSFRPGLHCEVTLSCDEPGLSCGDDNLIMKAARLLKEKTQTDQSATIHLSKRIPIGSGLGGGSSDAACALLGLNELWQLGLNQSDLLQLGAHLGSDVPFFLYKVPFVIGRGRGESCEVVTGTFRLTHVLVVPGERLLTASIYAGTRIDLTVSKPSITMVVHALSNGSLGELAKGFWNDLAPEAIRRCPIIALIQSRLRESGCLGSLVSGSGSSVFGLCRDLTHGKQVCARIRQTASPAWRVEIIQTDALSLLESREQGTRANAQEEGPLKANLISRSKVCG